MTPGLSHGAVGMCCPTVKTKPLTGNCVVHSFIFFNTVKNTRLRWTRLKQHRICLKFTSATQFTCLEPVHQCHNYIFPKIPRLDVPRSGLGSVRVRTSTLCSLLPQEKQEEALLPPLFAPSSQNCVLSKHNLSEDFCLQ